MGTAKYRLDENGQPVLVPDEQLLEWAEWLETADRVVAQTTTMGVMVSTVFLGLDHQFGDGPPLLWETMTFAEGKAISLPIDVCDRYSSLEDAQLGHELYVAEVERVRREAAAARRKP